MESATSNNKEYFYQPSFDTSRLALKLAMSACDEKRKLTLSTDKYNNEKCIDFYMGHLLGPRYYGSKNHETKIS